MPQHGQDGHGITTQANPAMPPRIGQPLVKYSVVDARSTIGAQREAILARGTRLPVGRIGRPEEVAALACVLAAPRRWLSNQSAPAVDRKHSPGDEAIVHQEDHRRQVESDFIQEASCYAEQHRPY